MKIGPTIGHIVVPKRYDHITLCNLNLDKINPYNKCLLFAQESLCELTFHKKGLIRKDYIHQRGSMDNCSECNRRLTALRNIYKILS